MQTPNAATLALGTLLLTCATQACTTTQTESMLPAQIEVVDTHPHSVSVHAEGSPRRMGLGPRFVASGKLQSAVEEAILASELFEALTTDENADFVLQVQILEVEKPEASLDMTAGVIARWSLLETENSSVLWMETVTTSFTASTAHTPTLGERLQASIEGAVRENIELGLQKVSALEL